MNHQIHSTTGESPYRMVFKQQMRMQRLSFADRATAIPEDEDEDGPGSELDASNRECESKNDTDSESLADGECDSEQSNGSTPGPTGRLLSLPYPSPTYIDSDGPDESARSQDSDFGLDDEIRTMFTNARQKTEKARNSMAQR